MSRIMADETKQLPMERWEEWCDLFTNGNAGRVVNIELVGDEEGAQLIADDIALVAVDYDPAGKGNDVVISYGQAEAPTHHVIDQPVALWQGQDINGRVVALEIIDEKGNSTIVSLSSMD